MMLRDSNSTSSVVTLSLPHAHCGDTGLQKGWSHLAEQDMGQNGEREIGEGWREGPLPLTLTLAPLPAGCPWFLVLGHPNLLCI